MNKLRFGAVALLSGAAMTFAVFAQSPVYSDPRGLPSQYEYHRDDDRDGDRDYGRGYDRDYDRAPRADAGFFYEELSYYGDWVMTRDYGWAWFPRNVHPYWRPYTDGRWVTTEYGWTWVSYEPFGWATYHYGRWTRHPRFGWLWVPGTIWGPAWVSWQHGGGYVGWAPLPPAVGFQVGVGLQFGGFNLSVGIRSDDYSFVPERSFLEPRLHGYMVPTARNVTMIRNTTNITNYTYIDNRVVNRGVEVRRIEQASGRRVQKFHVADTKQKDRSEVAQGEVRIYRPQAQQLDTVHPGPRPNAAPGAKPAPVDRDRDRLSVKRHDAPDLEVAPRVNRAPQVNVEQLEQQDRRAQQQLAQYQAQEKRQLEKLHQQQLSKARAQADRVQIEKQQQAEREALQQEQRNTAQQLQLRQKAQREAALADAPGQATSKGEKKPVDQQQGKKKGKSE